MIVTILPKSATFHAIAYNEKKVSEGRAQLLEMRDISGIASFPGYNPEQMTQFFMDYSARNDRIKYPQFHIAVSCKGTECTYEELLEFGRKYLQEMGYGQDGQPMLAYAHTDTDNRHVHFITSRVAPDGRKIEHGHERRRSQQVIARLTGDDIREKVVGDLAKAWNYTIKSIGEFRLVMQSLGYECYAKESSRKIFIKRGGSIQHTLSFDEVEAHLWENSHSIADEERATTLRKRSAELYALFNKYRHGCGSLDDFTDRMHSICGISMVFFGSKDNPTGYRVVDHEGKAVFYAPIELSKLQFHSYEERRRASLDMISQLLAENPQATSKEIGLSLYSQYGTHIKDYALLIDHKEEPLDAGTVEILRKNNIEAFKAANPRTTTPVPTTKKTARKPRGVSSQKVDSDLAKVWNYTIKSIGEFRLVMQSLGYECYAKESSRKIFIKRGGSIQHTLSFDEVEAHLWENSHSIADEERATELKMQSAVLYELFNKYRHGCRSLDDFADRMHSICGVSMVFFGSKDNPTGYRVVDHLSKAVFYAPIKLSKLQFHSYEERRRASLDMISRLLTENPQATSKEISRRLYRQYGTRIGNYALLIDNKKEPLDAGTAEVLKKNNIEAFKAANPIANEIKEKLDGDLAKAWNYTIKSIGEFKIVMQSLGYECYAKESSRKVFIKRGGRIQHSLSFDEVEAHLWENSHSIADEERATALKKRSAELYALFNKYRHGCGSLDDFADRMHSICGVSMVFFGSKDNPTGYRVVDHVGKAVFYAPIELSKLQFLSYEERRRASLDMISQLLAENPQATSKEIGLSLYSQYGTRIRDYALLIDHKEEPLDAGTVEILKKNNIEAFKAANPGTTTPVPTTKETPRKLGGVSSQNGTTAQGHSVNRDWEINSDNSPDDLDEQMRRQLKL